MVLAPQIQHFCSDMRINCICMQEVSWRYSNSHFKWFTTWVLQNSNIDLPIKCCSKKNCLQKEALLGNHTCPLPMIDFLKCFKNIYISSMWDYDWANTHIRKIRNSPASPLATFQARSLTLLLLCCFRLLRGQSKWVHDLTSLNRGCNSFASKVERESAARESRIKRRVVYSSTSLSFVDFDTNSRHLLG